MDHTVARHSSRGTARRLLLAAALLAPPRADESLLVTAHWQPLARSAYGFQKRWPRLATLAPAQPERRVAAAELAAFAPPAGAEVGTSWHLPNEPLLALARQLHATAQLTMHHTGDSPGGFALLVARSERFDLVQVRAHVDFPLDEVASWYTPAQLAGQFLFARGAAGSPSTPLAFRLGVPPRDSNVDLNWAKPQESVAGTPSAPPGGAEPSLRTESGPLVEADIGFVPRLELVANGERLAADGELAREAWTTRLDATRAERLLAERFYAFAAIDWLPLEEAVHEARRSGRPLHVVALFGTLDDESC
ncbi:MAG: hypothetical protein JNL90_16190 [Planctomycetes bacterium]|nr:hypothetical protein [Planctomycetota bacterium]